MPDIDKIVNSRPHLSGKDSITASTLVNFVFQSIHSGEDIPGKYRSYYYQLTETGLINRPLYRTTDRISFSSLLEQDLYPGRRVELIPTQFKQIESYDHSHPVQQILDQIILIDRWMR